MSKVDTTLSLVVSAKYDKDVQIGKRVYNFGQETVDLDFVNPNDIVQEYGKNMLIDPNYSFYAIYTNLGLPAGSVVTTKGILTNITGFKKVTGETASAFQGQK